LYATKDGRMVTNNFDLAPPPKTVDGLQAVPIDIQKITASLTFDGATSSGQGDATLEFVVGPENGNPIFDLRQIITAAWLDGVPLPVAQLAHHDFGGGPDAQLRIVESLLAVETSHTLRLTYSLGPPQAPPAGSYQPAMTWSVGPRLAFNFGFTDLGPGRYLEAWIPANLIFDQFEMVFELQVLNTPVAHTVITNGALTSLGTNHWSVAFPARFTALSTLLELRATDTLISLTDTLNLPISGTVVTIEAWKLASGTVNLATQINNLKTWLAANENNVGPYLHGNRFVAFLNIGGMEYEGGATAGAGSLQHETFHSWWARGVKPASQPDGWWDEAWTVYNVDNPSNSLPFDFTTPPVELCPRNPWVRVTAPGSYTAGYRFFQGVAAWLGTGNLNSFMSEFYGPHRLRPVTTTEIEEFLVCRTGNEWLVDAFQRFIYGFADPAPAPDLWLHDDPGDTGTNSWSGPFWDSPDLWIRNADDGITTQQPPEFGQDNWFYARVNNRSATATARHFLVTFNVKSFAGTQFQYPGDFLPCIAAASGFDLAPGQSTIVKARWPATFVPPPGTHACLLAAVLTRADHPVAGRHVWEHNNLAQKNLTIVDLAPNDWIIVPFVLTNVTSFTARRCMIELVRPKERPKMAVSLLHSSGKPFANILGLERRSASPPPDPLAGDTGENVTERDCCVVTQLEARLLAADEAGAMLTSHSTEEAAGRQFKEAVEARFTPGHVTQIPVVLGRHEQLLMGLRVEVPPEATRGEVLRLDVIQRDRSGKAILGGLAVEIRVQ
jgi:hypothetical protein